MTEGLDAVVPPKEQSSFKETCRSCGSKTHCVTIWGSSCTVCILRTQRLGYSPKNTTPLSSNTAKQQSSHENNETAFNLVINCRYEQANQSGL